MCEGEIARFIIAPEYAYGAKGFAPKVEPDETLDFEIELVSFKVRHTSLSDQRLVHSWAVRVS